MFAGSSDYAATTSDVTFTIAQAAPTLSVSDAGGTFDGSTAFAATATVAGVVSGVDEIPSESLEGVAPTIQYFVGSSAGSTTLSGAPSGAGTYTAEAMFAGSSDYAATTSDVTFTIAQAAPTVSVSDAGGTFDGLTAFAATATVAGVVSGVDEMPSESLEGVAPTIEYYAGTSTTAGLLPGHCAHRRGDVHRPGRASPAAATMPPPPATLPSPLPRRPRPSRSATPAGPSMGRRPSRRRRLWPALCRALTRCPAKALRVWLRQSNTSSVHPRGARCSAARRSARGHTRPRRCSPAAATMPPPPATSPSPLPRRPRPSRSATPAGPSMG